MFDIFVSPDMLIAGKGKAYVDVDTVQSYVFSSTADTAHVYVGVSVIQVWENRADFVVFSISGVQR